MMGADGILTTFKKYVDGIQLISNNSPKIDLLSEMVQILCSGVTYM